MIEAPVAQAKPEADWRRFIRKHNVAFAAFVAAAILAVAGAVYVFVWFTGNAQAIALVPSSLSNWSMENIVMFVLHTVFWELVLIGIPVVVGAVIGWQWWKRIPEQEKREIHLSTKRSKSRGAGGGLSFLLFVAFAIKLYVDGNWSAPLAGLTVDYVVGSMITILIWIVAIAAIPAVIGIVWWLNQRE